MAVRSSAIIFFLFFVTLAVYGLVTLKGNLSDAAIKYSVILLMSIVLTAVIDLNFFSFTILTIPVIMIVILAHYGSAAVSSYLMYAAGLTSTAGTQSIVSMWLHDIVSAGSADAAAVVGLALLNGTAEEALFTGAIYSGAAKFMRAKYIAAVISAVIFALYHTQSYLGVSPLQFVLNPSLWQGKAWLLMSPFVTQLVKCGLFQQEVKRGGGLLGVSLGHAVGNGLLMLAALGLM